MRNKRGWMKIIEAFSAILIIWVVLLTVISNNEIKKHDISTKVYNQEILILRRIQLNSTLRQAVIDVKDILIDSSEKTFPSEVNSTINSNTPVFLTCVSQICPPEDDCIIKSENLLPGNKEVYVQSVIITSTAITYSPKKLKIFCWQRQ